MRRVERAVQDKLTRLPDRRAFFERLRTTIGERSNTNRLLAVLILDLNRFREINAALGHHTADLLLQHLAQRLRDMLRESDTLARIGDDEFAMLLPTVMNLGHATLAANKIQKVMEEPFSVDGQEVNITGSIGIALCSQHGTHIEQLMQRADTAVSMAKRSPSGFAVYDSDKGDGDPGLSHLSLESELHNAIGDGELALYYQPKINIKTGQTHGVEALVRWDSPKRGFMPPDEFIPLAEATGLIQPLTQWVLNTALRQCASYARNMELSVAINLSPCNLRDPELPDLILCALETWDVAPMRLVLEITENAVMENPDHSLKILAQLSGAGLSLSIDDFGTGYSSLAYLRKLPVNELKIDKSFVMNMAEDQDNAMIVRSIIDLARNFHLKVVAEGVENEPTLDMLARLDCDYAQGYYISRPVPLAELDKWMTESPGGLSNNSTEG